MVQLLLDKGANINYVSVRGKELTPWSRFLVRCYNDRDADLLPTAILLLNNGADARAKVSSILPMVQVTVSECLARCSPVGQEVECQMMIDDASACSKARRGSLWSRMTAYLTGY